MITRALFLFLMVYSLAVIGQDSAYHSLQSPYQSVRTHLYFLQDDSYNLEIAKKPFQTGSISDDQAKEAAVKLKQILDGQGIYIAMSEIPRSSQFYDSTLQDHRYVLSENYPEIILTKQGSDWKFSEYSVQSIFTIHEEVYKFGTEKLLKFLPKLGTSKFLGMYLYQLLGILILIFTSFLIHKLLTYVFSRLIHRTFVQIGYTLIADRFLLPVARPVSLFFIIFLLYIFTPVLQLPLNTTRYIILALGALLPFFGMMVVYRFIDVFALYLDRVSKKTESSLDDQMVPLLRKTLKTFVVVIGTLFILDNLNIPILPLLTGLSIGGLAFALAAQDTIKNFFGSLMIFIDKPFQIGHWITAGDIDGSVEEVGFRSTRVRTFRNSLVYVPNGKLADSVIDNHGLRVYRRFFTQISITYDTPADLIEIFIEGLKKIVLNHPDTRKDNYNIYFNEMGSHSLNIMFYIFFQTPNWSAELQARHEVLLEIVKLADKLGINFAFPTQTLNMENFPGQPSISPQYASKEELKSKLSQYFKEPK